MTRRLSCARWSAAHRAATSSPPRAGRPDRPEIQSGIYNGKTTGTPICAVIRNTNQRSNDYAALSAQPRPGHADYTGMLRYDSCNDPRGGGHFSGRLTAPLVFAGALCKLWLKEQGVTVGSHIQSIAQIQDMPFDDVEVPPSSWMRCGTPNIR